MKDTKAAIQKNISLDDYILLFRYFQHQLKCNHVTGFVNAPMLYEQRDDAKIEAALNRAIKHGIITRSGGNVAIDPVVSTFINSWIHSRDVVALRKTVYGEGKGIFFAKAGGYYLGILQDVSKDRALLVADPDLGLVVDAFGAEIERSETDKGFRLKSANQQLAAGGRNVTLDVEPVARLVLQTITNGDGRRRDADRLIHLGKKELEVISLDPDQRISAVAKEARSGFREVILRYLAEHLRDEEQRPDGNGTGEPGQGAEETKNPFSDDPEFYTGMSFRKLTGNEAFPKSFFGLLKWMLVSFFKGFLNWKNALKRIGILVLMSCTALVWNLYALCYLNDTFNISKRAIFGNATAYLLAGIADTHNILGMPPLIRTVNTVTITAALYYLLALAVRSLVMDLVSGKVKSNTRRLFAFPGSIGNYRQVAPRGLNFYIWVGIIVAAVLNLVLFNPFTVALLGLMILFSCVKGDEGGIVPFLMIFHSSTFYKRVTSGKGKMPLFGEYELRFFGIGMGLILCSVLNWILWVLMDFNFWIRLILMIVLVIYALVRLGIVKFSRPAATATALFLVAAVSALIAVYGYALPAFADDGGWSESGGTLAGLMQNYGWQTVLGFSLTLAAAVAVGCVTAGLGTAVILGAAGTTFGLSAAAATFTEGGRKTAYDFIWGNYSPYGGDSLVAAGLNFAVSMVPGFGNAFGVVTGIRDCTYDIQHGDWTALALDGLGLGMDVHGLVGDVGDVLKHSDDIADAASGLSRHSDEIADALGNNGGEVTGAAARYADEAAGAMARRADEAAGAMARRADEAAGAMARRADEAAGAAARHADEAAGAMARRADEAAGAMARRADEAAGAIARRADEAAGAAAKHADEVAGAAAKHGDEVAGAAAKHSDEAAEAAAKHADDAAAATKKADHFVDDAALKQNGERIKALQETDPIKANEVATESMKKAGKDAGFSDEAIESYIRQIESDKAYDIGKEAEKAWGTGWKDLKPDEQALIKEIVSDEERTALELSMNKTNAMNALAEYGRRFEEGLYDPKYKPDQILDFKVNRNAGSKVYEGITNSEFLPRADEFISDEGVLKYVKNLQPDNVNIQKCTNLQELADTLAKDPVKVDLVTFQNADPGAINFLTKGGDFGDPRLDFAKGGGVFSMPASSLEEIAHKYPDLCSFDGGEFKILNQEEFGREVLSGVPLSSKHGAYMIRTSVPLDGAHLSMPSVNSYSAYMDQFVSGGRLLSNNLEVTQKNLSKMFGDVVPDPAVAGPLKVVQDKIEVIISVLK